MSRSANKSAGKLRKVTEEKSRRSKSPASTKPLSMADLLANIDNISEEERNQQYENYEKSGDFERDFVYLSLLRGIKLSIDNRLKFPTISQEAEVGGEKKVLGPTPSQEKIKLSASLSQDSTKSNILHSPPNASQEKLPEASENGCPQTYAIAKDSSTYFKPRLQIESEPDQKEHVKSLYLRGWKADIRVIQVLGKTLPQLDKLTVLNMWNTGLDNETLQSLCECLIKVPSLKTLCLDANSFATNQQFHIFIQQPSELNLEHLSLRHCKIDSVGASTISTALSSNTSLLTLNLCFNNLGDEGVKLMSGALSLNRTLLSLNIGSNEIGDAGVTHLCRALTRFPLTEEQVFTRRRKLSTLSEHHPNDSLGSSLHMEKPSSTSHGKRDKTSGKKKEQSAKAGGKAVSSKGKASWGKVKTVASVASKGVTKANEEEEVEADESPTVVDPLLEKGILVNGELYLPGNKVLINLNLSRNKITPVGLEQLYSAMKYQDDMPLVESKSNGNGLKKLSLQNNCFLEDDPRYIDIRNILIIRDPLAHEQMIDDHTDEKVSR